MVWMGPTPTLASFSTVTEISSAQPTSGHQMGLDWSLNLGSLPEKSALGRRRCYPFSNGNDGAYPIAGLTFDASGNVYGTTLGGGTHGGVVFRLKPAQRGNYWPPTVLYNFKGSSDGDHPTAGLVFDRKGNLYSTTEWGGAAQSCQGGCGTVFEVTP
jgi:hypothetical protein